MRFVSYESGSRSGIAAEVNARWHGLLEDSEDYPGTILSLVQAGAAALSKAAGALRNAPAITLADVKVLPPISDPQKIVCIGLNYRDHSAESGIDQPDFPTVFGRFNSSLIAHGD